ncbi:MAG: sigma-70 family RNA polymerase sigma factor [Verrucomicrobiota bacterium]|jgi:RNA polymerase sigma-70 factor (ECF subfamily)
MNATTLLSNDHLPTRYSLLSRLQDWDDQDSWKEFFDTYWGLIYSFALKSGLTAAEAEDVVQETIISVAKDIQKFKRDPKFGSFKGWLRNLTRWRIADQLRKRHEPGSVPMELAEQASIELDVAEFPASAEAESIWDDEWRANLMKVALDNVKRMVKEEHYQMFDLYVVKQWRPGRVAITLGVSVGQVYLVKYRLGALLKKEIRRLETSEIQMK